MTAARNENCELGRKDGAVLERKMAGHCCPADLQPGQPDVSRGERQGPFTRRTGREGVQQQPQPRTIWQPSL